MIEKSAKDSNGFILYNPFSKKYFFRIYHRNKDTINFTDYEIYCEEIEMQITTDWLSLYDKDGKKYLDWSSKALGKHNESRT